MRLRACSILFLLVPSLYLILTWQKNTRRHTSDTTWIRSQQLLFVNGNEYLISNEVRVKCMYEGWYHELGTVPHALNRQGTRTVHASRKAGEKTDKAECQYQLVVQWYVAILHVGPHRSSSCSWCMTQSPAAFVTRHGITTLNFGKPFPNRRTCRCLNRVRFRRTQNWGGWRCRCKGRHGASSAVSVQYRSWRSHAIGGLSEVEAAVEGIASEEDWADED